MDKGEPPSTCRAKSFRIGRNSRGNWVVQDQSGLWPQAVIMVPGILELDMSAQPRDQNRPTAGLHAPLARAA